MICQRARSLTFVFALAVIAALALAPAESGAAGQERSAREVFASLPESIFENTPEGLSSHEKQKLLGKGQSDFWEVAGETEDIMVFANLPFHDVAVALRLFRHSNDQSLDAAIGTLGGTVCTVELWRMDASGRLVPVDTPPEPAIEEFFAKDQKLPPDVQATVMICLGLGGLRAQPLFWTSTGMAHVPVAYDIGYQWNGKHFEKHVQPSSYGQ
ncbi:MAG: hypothetical protein PHI96_01135 [Desulfovibrio sp.]|nr:hypothetical protein [Desulfovibrio sp.]